MCKDLICAYMKKLTALAITAIIGTSGLMAQGFFSLSAGSDGFNVNVGGAPSLLMVPVHRTNPLLLVPVHGHGHHYDYDDDDFYDGGIAVYPVHHSKKYYKKAAKRYRKALKHARRHSPSSWSVSLSSDGIVVGGSVGGGYYYYDDDDDDFYEDLYEDLFEHHHKHHKVKKHHKHHKHDKHYKKKHRRHHDDDDDDDDD